MSNFATLPGAFAGPPTLVEGRGLARAWLTTPAGLVTQMADGTTMDAGVARWMMTEVTTALRAHGRAVGATRYRFVHDWRGVVRHDAEARRLIVEWGLSFSRGEIERIDLMAPIASSSLLGMAVSTGRMAMLAAGIQLEVVNDPVVALSGLAPTTMVSRR